MPQALAVLLSSHIFTLSLFPPSLICLPQLPSKRLRRNTGARSAADPESGKKPSPSSAGVPSGHTRLRTAPAAAAVEAAAAVAAEATEEASSASTSAQEASSTSSSLTQDDATTVAAAASSTSPSQLSVAGDVVPVTASAEPEPTIETQSVRRSTRLRRSPHSRQEPRKEFHVTSQLTLKDLKVRVREHARRVPCACTLFPLRCRVHLSLSLSLPVSDREQLVQEGEI